MTDQNGTPDPEPQGSPPAPPAPPDPLSLPADLVRQTPEYKAAMDANRQLSRDKARLEREAANARAQAEAAQQAAEARQQAVLEDALRGELGEEGLAFWQRFSDLSATDQVAAAKALREYAEGRAQTPPPATPPTEPPPAAEGGTVAQGSQPPTPPGRVLDGGTAPLTGVPAGPTPSEQLVQQLDQRFAETAARNQDFTQRNRVTMKDRAAAAIGYLGARYTELIAERDKRQQG